MRSAKSIIIVGSHSPGILMRVQKIPVAGETVIGWDFQEPMDGGKGSNQAIAAARLGATVYFIGCVGKDRLGDAAERWMQQAGVDTRYLRRSVKTATAVGFILLDAKGLPAMVSSLGANSELDQQDVDLAFAGIQNAGVLLTQFEIRPEIALYAARQAHGRGMISIVNPAPWVDTRLEDFYGLDIIVPNETEAMGMLGLDPLQKHPNPIELAIELRNRCRVNAVLVTLGEAGVVIADGNEDILVTAPAVRAIDTSGAGDAFCGALAKRFADGWTIRESAEWACQVAALSVTRPGTIPAYPTLMEVEEFLSNQQQVDT